MSSTNPDESLFALVDCNNFYVSCERVFNPKLINKPVVVLSNNDGCVIARSKESKALDIPMGAPLFQQLDLFKKKGVIACSSNYTLYGDMSSRVMETLKGFTSDIQVYSIDEAFLSLESNSAEMQGRTARQTIFKHTGIPVSIGIARTKTLAKVANHVAKNGAKHEGVFMMTDPLVVESILRKLPVQEIWGIGSRISHFLNQKGIRTAWDLRHAEDSWIRKHLSVVALRTVWELRGISCLELEEAPSSKKTITSSRSFGRPVVKCEELLEAVAAYTTRAAEKLRTQESLASSVGVYIESTRTYENGYYSQSAFCSLSQPTAYTPDLIEQAKNLLTQVFKPGLHYKKVGVFLNGLVTNKCFQQDLFVRNQEQDKKHNVLMQTVDQMNKKFGKKVIKWAAEGTKQPWKMRQDFRSARFTTCWEELLVITI